MRIVNCFSPLLKKDCPKKASLDGSLEESQKVEHNSTSGRKNRNIAKPRSSVSSNDRLSFLLVHVATRRIPNEKKSSVKMST